MKTLHVCLLAIIAIALLYCTPDSKSTIVYPKPLPDTTALTFLPELVSGDSFDFNASFSPDGKSYYFTRNIRGKTFIYRIKQNGAQWTTPELTSFTDTLWSQADPVFSPDGKMYFISNRPKDVADTTKDFDIWFSKPLDGDWTAPENFKAVNSDSNEYYISFTKTGDAYFGSSRPGGFGQEDVYVSRFVDGVYKTPENLGDGINTDKAEYDPFISADEKLLIFASSKRDDSMGGADLYISKFEKGKWTKAAHLDKHINTATRDFCPYISPDGKYFFFSSEADVKWIGIEALTK